MFECVKGNKLIIGEKYYIKRQHDNIHFSIFDGYNELFQEFAWFKISNDYILVEFDSEFNKFYRYVSNEEYYEKIKEKYDDKCLNIVLKRLVDESFQW